MLAYWSRVLEPGVGATPYADRELYQDHYDGRRDRCEGVEHSRSGRPRRGGVTDICSFTTFERRFREFPLVGGRLSFG